MGTHNVWCFGLFMVLILPKCHGSWGTPGLGQYHIQTDEGPERFFRYQTDNGQFRKEKRLQDGTVIGTDAWIDASGYLRQKDYIADNQGYRILKSKTIYVGKGRPIEEAMKMAKNQPPQAGILAKHESHSVRNYNRPTIPTLYSTSVLSTPTPTTSTTSLSTYPYLGYDHYPTPNVFIRPHSQPIDNGYYSSLNAPSTSPSTSTSIQNYYPSTTPVPIRAPSREFEPPIDNSISSVYSPSTTQSPITPDYGSSSIASYPESSTIAPPITSSTNIPTGYSSTSTPSISTTYRPYVSDNPSRYGIRSHSTPITPIAIIPSTPKPILPLNHNYLEVKPLTSHHRSVSNPSYYRDYSDDGLQYNNLENGYESQYPPYDGISVTNNGFRYYLPRQYHEEDNRNPSKRQGSFGYIDPFGIRRVIYYNTSPEQGFVHRKNNRFVGFNAKPYDPRSL